MMKNICAAVFVLTFANGAHAQTDTMYHYISPAGTITTADSAYAIVKMYKKDNAWYGKEYFKKNGLLRSEGAYAQNDIKTPVGSFKNYNEDGSLNQVSDWSNGTLNTRTWYYKNGDKKAMISFKDKKIDKQIGWDESGKEIKNYVVEREARFKGGADAWRRYLEKHLNANVAADAGAPEGLYEVKVQFVVNKEGYVSNVKAVNIPPGCKPCAAEAVNAIATGPTWEPAIQNNVPVIYQAIQFITFQVVDDGKKKKKG